MPLYTRCIKKRERNNDGTRISVMSRHTLADGITPDPDIAPDMYDKHIKQLGPPPRVIGAYCREEISWDEFAKKFREHLLLPHVQKLLYRLIRLARKAPVTILCVENAPERCHRRLIAERCKELDPFLEVHIE